MADMVGQQIMENVVTYNLNWEFEKYNFTTKLVQGGRLARKFILLFDHVGYRFEALLYKNRREKGRVDFDLSYDYGPRSRLQILAYSIILRKKYYTPFDSWKGNNVEMTLGDDGARLSIPRFLTTDRDAMRENYGIKDTDLSWYLHVQFELKVQHSIFSFEIEYPIAHPRLECHQRLFEQIETVGIESSDLDMIASDGTKFYCHRSSIETCASLGGLSRRISSGDSHTFATLSGVCLNALVHHFYIGTFHQIDQLSIVNLIELVVFSDQYDLDDMRLACEASLWRKSKTSRDPFECVALCWCSYERNRMLFMRAAQKVCDNFQATAMMQAVDRVCRQWNVPDRMELIGRIITFQGENKMAYHYTYEPVA